jgi:adenylate kinase
VIANRLRLYHELTEPVIDRYEAAGTLLPVEGEGTVEEVAAEIDDALGAVGAASP